MPERREDDQMDPITGIPVSAAHQAIYNHLDECKDELLDGQQKVVADIEAWHDQHIDERHHPPLNEIAAQLGRNPTQLMQDFIRSMQTSERVVDALDGPIVRGLDGVEHRVVEDGMIHQMKDIQLQMSNGIKHRAELSKSQYALAIAAIGALATIAAALLGG